MAGRKEGSVLPVNRSKLARSKISKQTTRNYTLCCLPPSAYLFSINRIC